MRSLSFAKIKSFKKGISVSSQSTHYRNNNRKCRSIVLYASSSSVDVADGTSEKDQDRECEETQPRPFPVRNIYDREKWRQGLIFARRTIVKQQNQSDSAKVERFKGKQRIAQMERDIWDDGSEGNELTLVTIKVPEIVAQEYREPGQKLQMCIDEDMLNMYVDELTDWSSRAERSATAKEEYIDSVLKGGAQVTHIEEIGEKGFDLTRDDEYSILDRRSLMQAEIDQTGDPNLFYHERDESLKDLAAIKTIVAQEDDKTMDPEFLTISSSPERYGSRRTMKATVDFLIPKQATGLGASLLTLPLNARLLIGDVVTSPTFDMLPIKTHHTVLIFADCIGMGPVRSLLDSSWWAHRMSSRHSANVGAHLFVSAITEKDLPFKDYFHLWSASRTEICCIVSEPSTSWINENTQELLEPSNLSGGVHGFAGDIRNVLKERGGLPTKKEKIAAILCGSRNMTADIKGQLLEYGVDDSRILVWNGEAEWKCKICQNDEEDLL